MAHRTSRASMRFWRGMSVSTSFMVVVCCLSGSITMVVSLTLKPEAIIRRFSMISSRRLIFSLLASATISSLIASCAAFSFSTASFLLLISFSLSSIAIPATRTSSSISISSIAFSSSSLAFFAATLFCRASRSFAFLCSKTVLCCFFSFPSLASWVSPSLRTLLPLGFGFPCLCGGILPDLGSPLHTPSKKPQKPTQSLSSRLLPSPATALPHLNPVLNATFSALVIPSSGQTTDVVW
mmetsp:Transcript_26475/g.64315  ORF Transcript_26475/g.64315 Transcript_26475/m.64315 type:complete len:239 (+) Transcript_26475:2342-3058(+)